MSFEDSSPETVWKRYVTCLASLFMPSEGVDEQLESTLERFQFYLENIAMMAAAKASPKALPERGTGIVTRVSRRPEFVVADE